MRVRELEDWTAQLDRDIAILRGRSEAGFAREETLAVLDNSFAELHAASQELTDQTQHLEQAVSEGAAARRRHEALVGLMTDGVLETDEWGVIRNASPAAAQLLNVRADYLQQKPLVLFVAEEERRVITNALAALGSDKVQRWDVRLQPRNTPPVGAMISAARVEGINGEPPTILWLIRDAVDRAADLRSWRSQRDKLHQEMKERSTLVRELDQSIADRLAGIRKLSRRVIELQDFEGHKLARELRERFGQTLGAIKLNLENLVRAVPEVRNAPLHRETARLVDVALQRLREIYFELSPPLTQGMGLVGMIRQLLARIPDPDKMMTSVEADALPLLSPQVESASMWLVREAVNNVLRHAAATALEVNLQREGNRLSLRIRDNGRGFNVPATRGLAERAGCFGLVGMEERVAILGGDIEIISAPRQGTEIRAIFPAAARE